MSNQWLVSILLAALVGSAATAMGFVLSSQDSSASTAPIALPCNCSPVECGPLDCEPVACVEPQQTTEQVPPDSAASRMRRRLQGTTLVLNPWDNDPNPNPNPNPSPDMNESQMPDHRRRGEPTMTQGTTKVLNPWE